MTIHTCSYSCDRPACIRAQRDELAARAETPTPPADAEQRARELLAAELYARSLHEDAYPVAVGAVLDGVVAASVAAIVSALSQQPEPKTEARGVVEEEAMAEALAFCAVEFRDKAHVAECRGDAGLARYYEKCSERVCLALALTEARNG